MKNQIIPFDYQNHEVRSLLINDEPWFVAKDVCDILDLENPSMVVSRLDEDEVTKFNLGGLSGETNIVSESGLYSLTLGSKKPEAKPFKRWITHDVIPAIRKTGSYSAKPMTQIEMLVAQAQAMCELERKTDAVNQRLTGALDALAAPTEIDWQTSTGDKVKRIAMENQLSYPVLFGDLYKELENATHVNLSARVSRLQGRMKQAGYKYTDRQAVSKLHVISLDPKLKLAFDGIVRRVDAKYTAMRLPQ